MKDVRLSRALVLEDRGGFPDGAGSLREEWNELGTVWAEMTPRTGRVTSGEEVALSRVKWRITVRAAPFGAPSRPEAGQRFREGERVFDIVSVVEGGPSAKWLVCEAEEDRIK